MSHRHVLTVLLLAVSLGACGDKARVSEAEGSGPRPTLPEPKGSLLPLVNIAPAKGWPAGGAPTAAAGLRVTRYADGLVHPRWLLVLPNGDVLVAETDAPPKPATDGTLVGKVEAFVMKRAGSGEPSANRITLLRDADGDGIAELRTPFLENLNSPFGMALAKGRLYIANTDAVVSVPYTDGQERITESPMRLAELPAGPINRHWTKSLIANADGSRLYVGVGANSNVAEAGLEVERQRAAILEIDTASGATRVYAEGLRNPVGLAWQPESGALWTAVNERDELGSDLVPDYMTSVKEGGFYGWPWSYYGQTVDTRVKPPRPEMVAKALAPDYALGAHTASLGLAWSGANALTPAFHDGMFIGQHGSWNRKPHSGYKVVFVKFAGGQPQGLPVEVLGGFLDDRGNALGRPVGVAVDGRGGLLVADDVGDVVWRISAAAGAPAP